MHQIFIFLVLITVICVTEVRAQYIDLSGNNPDIKQYVESSVENWNRPIFYIFYNGDMACESCPRAMEDIWSIYQKYYAETCSIFEIDYSKDFQMQIDYQLNQPLSLVVVRIHGGMSNGYYKLDNPQNWINDPFYLEEKITTNINTFLNS